MVTPNLSDDQANQKVSRHKSDMGSSVSHVLKTYTMARLKCLFVVCADDAACLQFSKGFDKKDVPSGKGYIRLTPQPNVA